MVWEGAEGRTRVVFGVEFQANLEVEKEGGKKMQEKPLLSPFSFASLLQPSGSKL